MGFEFRSFAESYIDSLVQTLGGMPLDSIEEFWELVELTRDGGGTVHFIGNGGSAGTPSHSAGDWSKELRLRTISHVDNVSSLTAWANDSDYENVFVGQLSTFLKEGDLVVGFSGSGNSPNVLNGISFAMQNGCKTVAVTGDYNGMGGGKLAEMVDVAIVVPSHSMERIEDLQLIINHIVKEAIKSNHGL
ncbi:MAG: SIS domain-containing protein [Candidatus Thalassarchaeaceae archaeon]|jgi:D-sedoheptulose 7-phosphate isomerase|nr:SIS domain-containing protein [Candidatus Thalassarchaeaceae archaeon]